MGRLAVIIGSSAVAPGGAGLAATVEGAGASLLLRHGSGRYTLPHLIDHRANLLPLLEAGCDRVLAIGSVGSLRPGLPVGSLVCPHDFIALQALVTTREDPGAHAVAGFDPGWRDELLAAWPRGAGRELRDGAVYWQTSGPRFETPAEIRLIAQHAELVGMTLASECVVACELGLRYAAVCAVDNLANGIGPRPLGIEELEAARAANVERLRVGLEAALTELAGR